MYMYKAVPKASAMLASAWATRVVKDNRDCMCKAPGKQDISGHVHAEQDAKDW